jgi:hypothetical protein
MDPYLEHHWQDVHTGLITYARDRLQPALPGGLRARIEERVFVESEEGEKRSIFPDVSVVESPRGERSREMASSGVAVAEPVLIHLDDEPMRQGYLEIVDVASGNRVITVIEFLSPANKSPGQGQDLYLSKQQDVITAGASLVEIDLTRAGRRVFSVPPERIPASRRTTYQICIRRGWKPRIGELYAAPLRERLPVVGIPLRQTDADVPLDLQALVDLCYENGRYDDTDYRVEPHPPLDPADAAWADEHLRAQGRR